MYEPRHKKVRGRFRGERVRLFGPLPDHWTIRGSILGFVALLVGSLGVGVATAPPASADHEADVHYAEAPWQTIDTDDGTDAPYPGTWSPGLEAPSVESTIDGQFLSHLRWPEDGPNLGTSLETLNLGLTVEAGDKVSVNLWTLTSLDLCSGGAPRVFVYISGTQYNSDDNCSGDITLPVGGTIGHAGVVLDNGIPGVLRVEDLVIGDYLISFTEHVDPPAEEPPAEEPKDEEPVEEPNDEDTQKPVKKSPIVVPTSVPAGIAEPVSMDSNLGQIVAAVGLLGLGLAGAGAYHIHERRRHERMVARLTR